MILSEICCAVLGSCLYDIIVSISVQIVYYVVNDAVSRLSHDDKLVSDLSYLCENTPQHCAPHATHHGQAGWEGVRGEAPNS